MNDTIKVLALDLDGTLTNTKKEITPRTRAALRRAAEAGVRIVLASGRPTVGVQYLAKELELDKLGGYILSYNGGCIVDCATGAVVAQEAFPPELVKPVCDEARATGAVAMSYNAEGVITEHPEDEYVQLECFTCRVPAIPVEDLGSFIDFDVNKILLSKNPDEIARVEEHMQQKFAGRLSIYKSMPYFLEIMPLGVEKAQSLRALLTILGLTEENLMACGDGWNDISMIRLAGVGIAMGNAVPQVKQAATWVTADNNHDGVGLAVEKFIFEEKVELPPEDEFLF
nr:Cof-type HAD-IIB family hydrolase [Fournierella massiliensis]